MGGFRRAGGRALDRKHEHCFGRQHDAVSGERPENKTTERNEDALRGPGSGSGQSGNRQSLWHGLSHHPTTGMDSFRPKMGQN